MLIGELVWHLYTYNVALKHVVYTLSPHGQPVSQCQQRNIHSTFPIRDIICLGLHMIPLQHKYET